MEGKEMLQRELTIWSLVMYETLQAAMQQKGVELNFATFDECKRIGDKLIDEGRYCSFDIYQKYI